MAMGKERNNASVIRKGGVLNNIEYMTSNMCVKTIRPSSENMKKLYIIFEDEFIKFKPVRNQEDKIVIKDCVQGTRINYRLYENLPGEVKIIFINSKNNGLESIEADLEEYLKTLSEDYSEIIGIGKGIGGLVASLLPDFFKENKGKIGIITIATPYWGIRPEKGISRKKYIPQSNELLRELFWEDFFDAAEYSLEGIRHINCVTDDIQKLSYTITRETQQIPEEAYTEMEDYKDVFSIEEVTRNVIRMLSPEIFDEDIIVFDL